MVITDVCWNRKLQVWQVSYRRGLLSGPCGSRVARCMTGVRRTGSTLRMERYSVRTTNERKKLLD